ncbi:hypothetical protein [uncultured Cohaesibacter sp.]|uniref:hypothetical protein n=1 Tax=uncultured Cohaesibacter sp. TaxID=1002546 RepID=UPI0037486746
MVRMSSAARSLARRRRELAHLRIFDEAADVACLIGKIMIPNDLTKHGKAGIKITGVRLIHGSLLKDEPRGDEGLDYLFSPNFEVASATSVSARALIALIALAQISEKCLVLPTILFLNLDNNLEFSAHFYMIAHDWSLIWTIWISWIGKSLMCLRIMAALQSLTLPGWSGYPKHPARFA